MPGDKEVHEVILKAMHGELSNRDLAMIGLSDETKRAIKRLIELNPVLEEAILNIADLCYRDGTIELVNTIGGLPPGEPEPDTCPICHKEHKPDQVFTVPGLDSHLIPGHEYIIHTKTSLQKYPRKWRMGFLGAYDRALQFSARGPDRTHSKQYGGTQTIPATTIIGVKEVEADHSKRYVGVPVK
jgi:hypothetical protein